MTLNMPKTIRKKQRYTYVSFIAILFFITFTLFTLTSCKTKDKNEWILLYEFIGDGGDGRHISDHGSITVPAVFVTKNISVVDDCVQYEGYMIVGEAGLSSYSYCITDNILYIQLRIDKVPHYASTGKTDIQIKDERIREIEKVVLWDEEESNRITVWEK